MSLVFRVITFISCGAQVILATAIPEDVVIIIGNESTIALASASALPELNRDNNNLSGNNNTSTTNNSSESVSSSVVIGCVLGAILFLITSISILYWYLSRNRWNRCGKTKHVSSGTSTPVPPYPFTSPEAVSHPLEPSRPANAAGRKPPRANENYPMKRVDVRHPTTTSDPVNASGSGPSSKNEGSVWDTRNPFYAPRYHSQISSGKKSGTSHSSHKSFGRTRSGRTSGSGRGGSSVGTGSVAGHTTVSSISFAHGTERQMEIDERIEELSEKLMVMQKGAPIQSVGDSTFPGLGSISLAKMTHDHQVMKLKGRIEKLAQLKESDWALGLTDVLPPGIYKLMNQTEPD